MYTDEINISLQLDSCIPDLKMEKPSSSLPSSALANPSLSEDTDNKCNIAPITEKGKRIQMVKMLCLTMLPILALWCCGLVQLTDLISNRTDNEKKERDLSILYLSTLDPETKANLVNEFKLTDQSIEDILKWPGNLDRYNREAFQSKSKMKRALNNHRQTLGSKMSTIEGEIQFYTSIIEIIIFLGYTSNAESKFAVVWKSLVAFQKITASKKDLGLERALGTMFYAKGGFETHLQYEMYNMKLFGFRANFQSARQFSPEIDYLESYRLMSVSGNISEDIEMFREDIQQNGERDLNFTNIDLERARWHYDNTSIYIDHLLGLQTSLGKIYLAKVTQLLDANLCDLILSACMLLFVLISCIFVTFSTENLIGSLQKYAVTLIEKTEELNTEKERTDSLLYQMVPKEIAEKLKNKQEVDAEYFKDVTILISDIYGFSHLSLQLQPLEIVQLLNTLYGAIDNLLDHRDIYKVETINDSYMVVSGLPQRNNHRHVREMAEFSLSLMTMIKNFDSIQRIQLRIGINTGPCMAGIVGSKLPRYCLFGDTVNTASRMNSHSRQCDMHFSNNSDFTEVKNSNIQKDVAYVSKIYNCAAISIANRIHVSHTTYLQLIKSGSYYMRKRGTINVKGKGEMQTYWLTGSRITRDSVSEIPDSFQSIELPGMVSHNEYTLDAHSYIQLPGRKYKTEEKITVRVPPNGVTKDASEEITITRLISDICNEYQLCINENQQAGQDRVGNIKNYE